MAWTFSDQGNGTNWTTGSQAATAVNVATGDLIVVIISVVADTTWCTGVTDTQGNIYTVRSAIISGNAANVVMAYCINAEANANNVITATFNNATGERKCIIASVFTPDSGETVTLDVAMSGLSSWEASPWETGTDDTTGDDEVCIAGVQSSSGSTTYSAHEIPGGTAATALTDPAQGMDGWYRILSAIANGLFAEVDSSGSAGYAMEMLCFKSVAAGIEVTATLDELVITEYNPTVFHGEVSFTAGLDALAITEYAADVNLNVSVTAGLDALAITKYNATVKTDISFDASLDALVITEYNAVVKLDTSFTAGLDALVITEYGATVKVDISFDAGLDVLTITEYNAVITVDASVDVTATLDTLIITEYDTTILAPLSVIAGLDLLILTEYNPVVAFALAGLNRRGSSGLGFSFRDGWR